MSSWDEVDETQRKDFNKHKIPSPFEMLHLTRCYFLFFFITYEKHMFAISLIFVFHKCALVLFLHSCFSLFLLLSLMLLFFFQLELHQSDQLQTTLQI